MTLADYVKELMGDTSINVTASEASVSNGALHNILRGVTEKPTPDLLERLAKYFGRTNEEKQAIYARMMELAGHLDLMPPHLRPAVQEPRLDPDQMLKKALADTEANARAMGITEEDEIAGEARERNSQP